MTSKFTELAIDCADPGGLALFWCSALDYQVHEGARPPPLTAGCRIGRLGLELTWTEPARDQGASVARHTSQLGGNSGIRSALPAITAHVRDSARGRPS
jgi:hypothetical protein